ncbi:MAG: heavy metal translocating P-type ATPase [Clostridia bacterium]|nr:heavy metal translocating P-type ATPase [Clostridia bacterium]
MTRKQKRSLYKIIAAAVLYIAGLLAEHLAGGTIGFVTSLIFFAAAYILVGLEVLIDAVKGILRGEWLDENFLMAIATVGAVLIGQYDEGVAVMLFYQVGELFQSCAVSRSRESITALMDLRADYADVERDGQVVRLDPEDVEVGEIIVVRPGEKLPLDGVIIEGATSVNTAALTGESLPRVLREGDEVLSGCVNGEGLIRVRVTKPFGESTAAKILELVENSSARKSRSEAFITKFARVYTPLVVLAAALIAVIPPFFTGFDTFPKWIFQGLTFLVISCPCALVISVPLAFFGGIGAASRQGILVKGGNYLEALAGLETVVFDKTGTLTKGSFRVEQVRPSETCDADTLLRLAAKCEAASSHPIARSILDEHRARFGGEPDVSDVSHVTEMAGGGVTCMIGGETVAVGGRRLMKSLGIDCETPASAGTVVHAASTDGQSADGTPTRSRWLGCMVIADEVKPTSADAISRLRKLGVKRTVMLTGDAKPVAAAVAESVGVDEYEAELLPAGKVDAVERLLENKKGTLAFVGDGLNDAPVLSRADVGIAMGGIGSDAAIEAADVVLMDDDPSKIASAVSIARRTILISKQNIIFALTIKALILLMGLFGHANMWLAVFADVGVSVIAILNAMRCLKGETRFYDLASRGR